MLYNQSNTSYMNSNIYIIIVLMILLISGYLIVPLGITTVPLGYKIYNTAHASNSKKFIKITLNRFDAKGPIKNFDNMV